MRYSEKRSFSRHVSEIRTHRYARRSGLRVNAMNALEKFLVAWRLLACMSSTEEVWNGRGTVVARDRAGNVAGARIKQDDRGSGQMNKSRLAIALLLATCAGGATAETMFFSDFDSTLPAEIAPGTALLTGVQYFAGLGPTGNQFGGNFLRSATGNGVTLTLNNLPTHSSVSLGFLFAAIDSLDGTGTYPSGDFFRIDIDGQTVFRESFANAVASQLQSYVPPAGVELARHQNLGFGGPDGYYTDSAYDFGVDPRFRNIAHSASSLTVSFLIEGEGIQSLDDESWAMDNLRVEVEAVPVPAAAWLFGSGVVGLAGLARRRA
jgi:hypothetical protein